MKTPDPAYIQRNVQSLSAIGGLYDLLALEVERRHIEILRPYRLDTGAKSAVDLIAERGQPPKTQHTNTPTHKESEPKCPS